MANTKRYWTGLDDLHQTEAFQTLQGQEFPQHEGVDEMLGNDNLTSATTGRRDFLKFMGFSLAAATLAACETPVVKSIPYVIKPEGLTPGVANHYASTYYNGHDYMNVLVKTREGRPIFHQEQHSDRCRTCKCSRECLGDGAVRQRTPSGPSPGRCGLNVGSTRRRGRQRVRRLWS